MATAGSITVDLLCKSGAFVSDVDRAGKELERLSKRAAAASAGIDKQVRSLELQAANYGKSTREATLYELALKGASASQLRAAESALASVEAQEKLAAASRLAVTAVAAVGAGVLVAAAAFDQLTKYAGSFQDLADVTGASAVDLASLAVAAGQAGVSMESIGSATNRLTKGLVGVDEESSEVRAGLKALNIDIESFKKLDPVAQYEAVGKALGTFADGAGKTAVAQQILGKAGAEQLKVFKALEDQGGRTNILTAEQIKLADDYADRQGKNAAALKLYAAAVATQFIEPSNALITVAKDAIKQLTGLGDSATTLGTNDAVRTFAESAGRELAKVGDYVRSTVAEFKALTSFIEAYGQVSKQLLSGDFAGAKKTGADFRAQFNLDEYGRKKQDAAGTAAGESFVNAYDRALAAAKRQTFADKDPRRLDLDTTGKPVDGRPQLAATAPPKKGSSSTAEDPAKKALDNTLKAYSDAIRAEDDLLAQRNKALGRYNDQGLLSLESYYDTQLTILKAATTAQQADYSTQIASATAYRDSLDAAKKPKEFESAKGKVDELQRASDRAEQAAGEKLLELDYQRAQATKRLGQEFQALRAQVLELGGDLAAAAEIKFDTQYEGLRKTFSAEGNQAALNYLDTLRGAAVAQADLNKFAADYSAIQGRAQIAEDRIALAVQTGQISGIEGMRQTTVERQKELALLEEKLVALEKIDVASRTDAQVLQVEQYRLAIENLRASLDPLALKLNSIFEDSFGNSLADFISGTKSAKEAFSDFSKSVLREVSNLIAKDIAKSIFGGDGGIGGLLSGLLGGGKGGAGGGGGGGIGGLLGSVFGGGSSGGSFFDSIGSFFGRGSGLSIDTGGLGIDAASHGFSAAADSGLTDLLDDDFASLFFEKGGYTGDAGLKEAAGVVHGQEFVMSAPAVRAIGVHALDAIHRKARAGRVSLPGYEEGGYVGRMPPASASSFKPRTAGMAEPAFSNGGRDSRAVNVTQNFSVSGPVTRETEQQLAAAAARGQKRALARSG